MSFFSSISASFARDCFNSPQAGPHLSTRETRISLPVCQMMSSMGDLLPSLFLWVDVLKRILVCFVSLRPPLNQVKALSLLSERIMAVYQVFGQTLQVEYECKAESFLHSHESPQLMMITILKPLRKRHNLNAFGNSWNMTCSLVH